MAAVVHNSAWYEWANEWLSGWVVGWVREWLGGWLGGWVSELVTEWVSEWLTDWVSGEWLSDQVVVVRLGWTDWPIDWTVLQMEQQLYKWANWWTYELVKHYAFLFR